MQVKNGSKVKVQYEVKLDDGTVVDSTANKPPFEFQLGSGQVIPGFEEVVIGMKKGDRKSVKISPDKAYGEHQKEGVVQVPKKQFPPNAPLKVGEAFNVKQQDGSSITVTITAIEGSTVTLDANHPLAGRTLNFQIELLEVQ